MIKLSCSRIKTIIFPLYRYIFLFEFNMKISECEDRDLYDKRKNGKMFYTTKNPPIGRTLTRRILD